MNIERFIKTLREEFTNGLSSKTSWGRNEVEEQLSEAIIKALIVEESAS